MNDCDATQDFGHLTHKLGVGVYRRGYVTPLKNWMNESGELQGVGGKDGSPVACNGKMQVIIYFLHFWISFKHFEQELFEPNVGK